jgi:hypothetical protein
MPSPGRRGATPPTPSQGWSLLPEHPGRPTHRHPDASHPASPWLPTRSHPCRHPAVAGSLPYALTRMGLPPVYRACFPQLPPGQDPIGPLPGSAQPQITSDPAAPSKSKSAQAALLVGPGRLGHARHQTYSVTPIREHLKLFLEACTLSVHPLRIHSSSTLGSPCCPVGFASCNRPSIFRFLSRLRCIFSTPLLGHSLCHSASQTTFKSAFTTTTSSSFSRTTPTYISTDPLSFAAPRSPQGTRFALHTTAIDGSECGRDLPRFGLDSISPEIGCL